MRLRALTGRYIFRTHKHVPKIGTKSSGYPSWVQSEEDKDRYVEKYRRAEGIVLDNVFNYQKCGRPNFG